MNAEACATFLTLSALPRSNSQSQTITSLSVHLPLNDDNSSQLSSVIETTISVQHVRACCIHCRAFVSRFTPIWSHHDHLNEQIGELRKGLRCIRDEHRGGFRGPSGPGALTLNLSSHPFTTTAYLSMLSTSTFLTHSPVMSWLFLQRRDQNF